jgi:UDP-MurNAc hydroxylase
MKITHISNSFLVVETVTMRLACDPWVGHANHGAWHSVPEYNRDDLIRLMEHVDCVYISHLHSDHFDPQFLKDSGLTGKEFFIPRLKSRTLHDRLKALGVRVVRELIPWWPFHYNAIQLTIVPQMTSTTDGLEDEVCYDLDSSLIVHDGETFFNQVDNPLSADDYRKVARWIEGRYGKLDIAALVFGAASEYPQCFKNVDRYTEKRRIVEQSLVRMNETLGILKPTVFFPAGGSYIISGKNHSLNEWIAQPTFDEIQAANETDSIPFLLEGGWTFGEHRRTVTPIRTVAESIAFHSADVYQHELERMPLNEATVKEAAVNWLACGVPTGWVTFDIGGRKFTYEGDEDRHLTIHMDESAFMRCVTGKASWNQTLSGSLCTFEREPNIHYPNDLFSLNHFRATALRMAA